MDVRSGPFLICMGSIEEGWNRKGTSAIYLATDSMTAVREYIQDFQFLPVTLAQYRLTDALIAELDAPELLAAHGTNAAIHTVPWRAITLQGKEPLQWPLVDALISDGWHGAEYPSAITPVGRHIVLWFWNQKGGASLALVDPDERLPVNQASWYSEGQ